MFLKITLPVGQLPGGFGQTYRFRGSVGHSLNKVFIPSYVSFVLSSPCLHDVNKTRWMVLVWWADGFYTADVMAGFYHILYICLIYTCLYSFLESCGCIRNIFTKYLNSAFYLPVAKNQIENIHMEIKMDQNKPLNFTFGKTGKRRL